MYIKRSSPVRFHPIGMIVVGNIATVPTTKSSAVFCKENYHHGQYGESPL